MENLQKEIALLQEEINDNKELLNLEAIKKDVALSKFLLGEIAKKEEELKRKQEELALLQRKNEINTKDGEKLREKLEEILNLVSKTFSLNEKEEKELPAVVKVTYFRGEKKFLVVFSDETKESFQLKKDDTLDLEKWLAFILLKRYVGISKQSLKELIKIVDFK